MPAITLSTLFQTLYHSYNFYLLLFSLLHWKVCIFNCHEHIFLYDVECRYSNTSAPMTVILTQALPGCLWLPFSLSLCTEWCAVMSNILASVSHQSRGRVSCDLWRVLMLFALKWWGSGGACSLHAYVQLRAQAESAKLTHRARTPFSENPSQTSPFRRKCSHPGLWHLLFQTRLRANHDGELYPSRGTGPALPLDGCG